LFLIVLSSMVFFSGPEVVSPTLVFNKPKVSINKAYAEGAYYVDDPTITEKGTKSFTEKVKEGLRAKYNNVAANVKRTVTIENAKRIGQNVITNTGNNMREDIGNLGHEVKKFGVIPAPRKSKRNRKQRKSINNNVNTLNVIVKKRETTLRDVGNVSDPLAGMFNSPKRNMNNNNFELPAFRNINVNSPKPLKGNKTNLSGMNNNFELPMFKRKKGGLF